MKNIHCDIMRNIDEDIKTAMRREIPFARMISIFCLLNTKHRLGLKTYDEALDLSSRLLEPMERQMVSAIWAIKDLLVEKILPPIE